MLKILRSDKPEQRIAEQLRSVIADFCFECDVRAGRRVGWFTGTCFFVCGCLSRGVPLLGLAAGLRPLLRPLDVFGSDTARFLVLVAVPAVPGPDAGQHARTHLSRPPEQGVEVVG